MDLRTKEALVFVIAFLVVVIIELLYQVAALHQPFGSPFINESNQASLLGSFLPEIVIAFLALWVYSLRKKKPKT